MTESGSTEVEHPLVKIKIPHPMCAILLWLLYNNSIKFSSCTYVPWSKFNETIVKSLLDFEDMLGFHEMWGMWMHLMANNIT